MEYRDNSLNYWNETHKNMDYKRETIKTDDWLDRFDDIIMSARKPILDLGCGGGNNTLYLIGKGKQVIPCDQSMNAIESIRRNFEEINDAMCFNMLDEFPFEDAAFDVVIADLCLHYFNAFDTNSILSKIIKVLVPGGHMMLRVNSVNDVNHGAGQGREVEHHVYENASGTLKRFFDEEDIRSIFKDFEIEYLEEETMNRYRFKKYVYTVCVKKPVANI